MLVWLDENTVFQLERIETVTFSGSMASIDINNKRIPVKDPRQVEALRWLLSEDGLACMRTFGRTAVSAVKAYEHFKKGDYVAPVAGETPTVAELVHKEPDKAVTVSKVKTGKSNGKRTADPAPAD